MIRIAGLVVMVVSFSGCSQDAGLPGELEDYGQRLARVLEMPEVAAALSPDLSLRYPDRRNLQRAFKEYHIDLSDFLGVLTCELNTLIAERNSGLGKVWPASHQWRYEVKFIRLAQRCARDLDGTQPDLAAMLASVAEEKRGALSTVAWNATWAGPEFQTFLALRPLDLSAVILIESNGVETARALENLTTWTIEASHADQAFETGLERANRALIASPRLGEILYEMERTVSFFQRLNRQLEKRLQGRPICLDAHPNERARIAVNVLTQRYIGRIQPQLAGLQRLFSAWAPPLASLYHVFMSASRLEVGNDAVKEWITAYLDGGDQGLEHRFHRELQVHAALWTQLMGQCGMSPGNR